MNNEVMEECEWYEQNEWVFSGSNTINTFCQWLFSEGNNGATVTGHNFQSYDLYPILDYLYKNTILPKLFLMEQKSCQNQTD